MAIFGWFGKTATAKPVRDARDMGVGVDIADLPAPGGPVPGRKAERSGRREQLYEVVRDAMTRAGVLSASYKFKVLSLDSRGGSYLVMMDLSSQAADEVTRLAEIESLIAQNAKGRHEILVSAVYWRLNEHVTAGLSARKTVPPRPVAMAVSHASAQKTMDVNELMTFKNAFASAAVAAPLAGAGEILKSGRRNPQPQVANTEVHEGEERASPLGTTQYGELN
jgi:hypothetical protein